MKFFDKYKCVSLAVLAAVLIVQLVPFTHSTKIYSEVEDAQQVFDEATQSYITKAKTWAQLPIGVAGKDRGSWPSEIKFGEYEELDPATQEKYPLYGEKQISIFTYVWNPAGALYGHRVNAYILLQVLFLTFALFAFLIKNFMAKAVAAFLLGLSSIFAFTSTIVLKVSGDLQPYMVTTVLVLITGLAAIAAGVYFIPEYFPEKAHNEAVRKSL